MPKQDETEQRLLENNEKEAKKSKRIGRKVNCHE
jgi:hypothetical protein